MSKWFEYPCGCKFEVVGTDKNGSPLLDFNTILQHIPLHCQRTWDLIGQGNTKGVFQLESQLGQAKAKSLRPLHIEHLSALAAILRPGCLNSKLDNKSITDKYIDRKNNVEPIEVFHPALKDILESTYQVLIYQESIMQVSQKVAGFTLLEADSLRKGIGKKKTDIIAKLKKEFIDKACELKIITKEDAEQIFGWIEKSARYSFNKSHSVSYAIYSYITAYAKAHFPRVFFTAYLRFASLKIKPKIEIKNLVNNARSMNIDVLPPYLPLLNKRFKLHNKQIYFGLLDIKGIGESGFNSMLAVIETEASKQNLSARNYLESLTWYDFLIILSDQIKTTIMESLISSGATKYKIDRTKMLFEYKQYLELTDREREWVKQNYTKYKSLQEVLEAIILLPTGKGKPLASKTRVPKVGSVLKLLQNPPYNLTDSIPWIAATEENLLGISLTCSNVDSCDTSSANCSCKDFLQKKELTKNPVLAVNVEEVKEHTAKNGCEMAFLVVSDTTGVLESVVVFADQWKLYKQILVQSNTVLLAGVRDKKQDSFLVNKVFQL